VSPADQQDRPSRFCYTPPTRLLNAASSVLFTIMSASNRDYCFTVHCAAENECPDDYPDGLVAYWTDRLSGESPFAGVDLVRFASYQLEQVAHLHVQGFIQLSRKITRNTLQRSIPFLARAHIEPRKGTVDEARKYTTKVDSRIAGPWEYGECHGQGHRSDIADAAALAKSSGLRAVAEAMPGVFINNYRGLEAYLTVTEDMPKDPTFIPRPWQQKLLDTIALPPDDRHIIWVSDTTGNKGKSRLTRHLLCEHGALALSGPLADMKYAFCQKPARLVIMDITRAQAEYSAQLYTMAEQLKNGFMFNTKYTSKQVVFEPPHVIFMSNFEWDRSKWSADRVIHIDLDVNEDAAVALRYM